MPDRVKRGLLESIFSGVDATETDRKHLAEIILMVALSDSFVQDEEVEQIIDTIATYGEIESIPRAWIADRSEELRENAPLFSDERETLVRDFTNPKARRLGVTLAAKLVSSIRLLQEEEKAVLVSLCDAFKISDNERPQLFAPWSGTTTFSADAKQYQRCAYNEPDKLAKQTIFDAMRMTDSESEFRMLTHKLRAIRSFISKQFESADVLALGEIVRVGPFGFRMDGLVEHASLDDTTPGFQRWLVRSLAVGESLHPLEHAVISTMAHRLDESAHVLIVHTGDLSSTDKVFLQAFPPHLVREERIEP